MCPLFFLLWFLIIYFWQVPGHRPATQRCSKRISDHVIIFFFNSTGFILKCVIHRCASLFWQWSREAGQIGHIRKILLQHIIYYFTPLCMCSGMASVSHFWHSSRIWTLEMKWGLLFEVFCLSFLPFEKSVPSSLLASSSTILLQIIIDFCSS